MKNREILPFSLHCKAVLMLAVIICCPLRLNAQWQPVQMPATQYNSLAFVQDSVLLVCWSYFAEKTFYRSRDFGNNWTVLPDSVTSYGYNFEESDGKIYAYDAQTTIVSSDGGLSWKHFNPPGDGTLYGYLKVFWHDTLIMSDPIGRVIRRFPDDTRDTVFSDPTGLPSILLERVGDRFILAAYSGIFYSDDAGKNWTAATGAPGWNPANPPYFAKSARLGNRVFLLMRFQGQSQLWRSGDLGASWQEDPFFANSALGCDKDFLNLTSKAVYITTDCPALSGDSSRVWRFSPQDSEWQPFKEDFRGMQLIVETDSVLVGSFSNGSIYRSTDAGKNWYASTFNQGVAYQPYYYFHWPDGHSLVLNHGQAGWHFRPDTTSFYRAQPQIGTCIEHLVRHGDSLFFVCSNPYSVFYSPDRGISWDTLIAPINLPFGKIEKLFWDSDGLYAQIADTASVYRQLGRWSFLINDWVDLHPLPFGVADWVKTDAAFYAVKDDGFIYVSTDKGASWTATGNFPAGITWYKIEAGGDILFVITLSGQTWRSDNGGITWTQLPPFLNSQGNPVSPETVLATPGGDLFAIAYSYAYFSEDGGLNWYNLDHLNNNQHIDGYTLRIGPDGMLYGVIGNRLFRRPGSDYRRLVATARVVLDQNKNGLADMGESPVAGAIVASTGNYSITDSAGVAKIALNPNVQDSLFLLPVLPNTGVFPSRHVAGGVDTVYTFLIQVNNPRYLEPGITPQHPSRPGFENVYHLHVSNYGAHAEQGAFKFIPDPLLNFVSADPQPQIISGDTLIWQIDDLPGWQTFTAAIHAKLSVSAPLNGTLRSYVQMQAMAGAGGPAVIVADTLEETIVGSFDPNDKQVTPKGNLTNEDVENGLEMIYTIRFQNTGTYLAENVLVTDTLPTALDPGTFRFLGASHPCMVRLDNPNILKFYFQHILLPDSNANEPASHGYLKFSIRPKRDLPVGKMIVNNADIYFDFNEPVRTNATTNIIVSDIRTPMQPGVLPLQCYPTPAGSGLWVEWPGEKAVWVEIFTNNGSGAGRFRLQSGEKNRLPVQHLSPGLYHLRVLYGNRVYVGSFMKL